MKSLCKNLFCSPRAPGYGTWYYIENERQEGGACLTVLADGMHNKSGIWLWPQEISWFPEPWIWMSLPVYWGGNIIVTTSKLASWHFQWNSAIKQNLHNPETLQSISNNWWQFKSFKVMNVLIKSNRVSFLLFWHSFIYFGLAATFRKRSTQTSKLMTAIFVGQPMAFPKYGKN